MSPTIQRVTYSRGSGPPIQAMTSQTVSKMAPKLTSGSSAPPGARRGRHGRGDVGEPVRAAVVGDRGSAAELLGDPGVGVAVVLLQRLEGGAGGGQPVAVGVEDAVEVRDHALRTPR